MVITKVERELIFDDSPYFSSCHASTLVILPNDDVFVAWFAGSEEGAKDVNIWCARKSKGRWRKPFELANDIKTPLWNPVLFFGDNNILYLYYKSGQLISDWRTMVMESFDEGLTWSVPEELVDGDMGGRGPVKNKSIILQNGTWLAPGSTETGLWKPFVDLSRDQGDSWHKIDVPIENIQEITGEGYIQPALWESSPNHVHMLIRSSEGYIFRSDSYDGGKVWCPIYRTDLPNNNSGIDIVKLDDGGLILVYNPVSKNWGPRSPLEVAYSEDNGKTWSTLVTLEDDDGEYAYPAIVSSKGKVHISYTYNRNSIAYANFFYQEQ